MHEDEFVDLYFKTVEDHHYLGWFLQGHLVIEYILRRILVAYDSKLEPLVSSLNHARVVSTAFDLGLIDDKQREVLVLINKIRNKFAHQIDYMPSIEDCRDLWVKAKGAFTDMTDGIDQGLAELESAKSLDDAEDFAIKELFVQISYDLEGIYFSTRETHAQQGDTPKPASPAR